MEFINCVSVGNTNDFELTGASISIYNCASDDGDGTNAQVLVSTNNYEDEFVDYVNNNFALVVDSVCIGNGLDDPGSGLYDDDIVGTQRSSTWDIGPHEYS